MIQALIFDFDGLIVDTEVPDFESWRELYEEHGCHLDFDAWAVCIGLSTSAMSFNPLDELERQLGREIDRDAIRARRRKRYLELVAAQPLLPGVAERIAEAKGLGLKLGVASSATRDWVTGHLTQRGLIDYFDCVRCVEDVQRAKPDPDVYLAALGAIGAEPGRAIAFEDSPNGALAAKRAGLYCVAVPNGMTRHLPLDHADLRINSLADLTLSELLNDIAR